MSRVLWGLLPDGSNVARLIRGVLLGAITGALPLLTVDGEITTRRLTIAGVSGALGALAGWLRAGEPNQPTPERQP